MFSILLWFYLLTMRYHKDKKNIPEVVIDKYLQNSKALGFSNQEIGNYPKVAFDFAQGKLDKFSIPCGDKIFTLKKEN